MNNFELINCITKYNVNWNKLTEQDKKDFNVFSINRMLSNSSKNIDIVNLFQRYPKIPKNIIFNVYSNLCEEENFKYNKRNINNKDLVNIISNYYEISNRESKEYLLNITKDELKLFLYSIGLEEKEIKKLLK